MKIFSPAAGFWLDKNLYLCKLHFIPKRGPDAGNIVYRVSLYTGELALTFNGSCPKEFLESSLPGKRARILARIRALADQGRLSDRGKFKRIEGREFFEFKDFQTRVGCYFQPGKPLIITHGFIKKKDKIPPSELDKARSIRAEYNQRFGP